jgi:hypothetical protein
VGNDDYETDLNSQCWIGDDLLVIVYDRTGRRLVLVSPPRASKDGAASSTRPVTRPVLPDVQQIGGVSLSPDGKLLAYVVGAGGQTEFLVRPADPVLRNADPVPPLSATRRGNGTADALRIATATAVQPQWSCDGTALFFRQGTKLMRCAITTNPTLAAGALEEWADFDKLNLRMQDIPFVSWAPLPDGSILAVQAADDEIAAASRIDFVQNLFSVLKPAAGAARK